MYASNMIRTTIVDQRWQKYVAVIEIKAQSCMQKFIKVRNLLMKEVVFGHKLTRGDSENSFTTKLYKNLRENLDKRELITTYKLEVEEVMILIQALS